MAMSPETLPQLCALPPMKILQSVGAHIFGGLRHVDGDVRSSPFDIWKPKFISPDLEYAEIDAREQKAAKADDAETNILLWNLAAVSGGDLAPPVRVCNGTLTQDHERLFEALRNALYLRFCRNLVTSFWRYLSPERSAK